MNAPTETNFNTPFEVTHLFTLLLVLAALQETLDNKIQQQQKHRPTWEEQRAAYH